MSRSGRADHASSAALTTGFVPSVNGFAFPNRWEDRVLSVDIGGRTVRLSLHGRCGGMAFAALDHHRTRVRASEVAGTDLPDRSSTLARYILRRQIESHTIALGSNLRRFALEIVSPTGTAYGTASRTRAELGRVLAAMVAGNPVPLGLVTADRLGVGLNHQVVACGAVRTPDELRIAVYDPNLPGRDDVELVVSWRGTEPVSQVVGGLERKQWRGLFVERYAPRIPPGASG